MSSSNVPSASCSRRSTTLAPRLVSVLTRAPPQEVAWTLIDIEAAETAAVRHRRSVLQRPMPKAGFNHRGPPCPEAIGQPMREDSDGSGRSDPSNRPSAIELITAENPHNRLEWLPDTAYNVIRWIDDAVDDNAVTPTQPESSGNGRQRTRGHSATGTLPCGGKR